MQGKILMQVATLAAAMILSPLAQPQLSAAAAGAQNAGRTEGPLAAPRAIAALSLTPISSPDGEFTMAVPDGWSLSVSPQADFAAFVKPPARTSPAVYLFLFSVSDLRYRASIAACAGRLYYDQITQCAIPSIQAQLADSSREWTPKEGLQKILEQINRGGQGFGVPALIPISWSQAFYRVAGRTQSGEVEDWGVVSMAYLPNPVLGPRAVTSLAFISGCASSPDQADSFRSTCAGALDSFRAAPNWAGRLAQRIMTGYDQEAQILLRMGEGAAQGFAVRGQMIADFGRKMQEMQAQNFEAIQARNYRAGQGWIQAFAGNTIVRDPATGKEYAVPYGYGSYCLDAAGATVLMGPDEMPGKSIGNAVCGRKLSP